MEARNRYNFSFITLIAFLLLTPGRSFSQTDQKSQSDTTETPYAKGLTQGRAKSLVGVVVGLASMVIGLRSRRNSATATNRARSWPAAGLGLGIVALILSILHIANTDGGFGTGGGKAGAIVAFVLGLVGAVLSGVALRQRK
jgi:peptidoglycan/LPS O-acetylase OafA/YrhL